MSLSKHIVLFGAGKSATVLIDYLKDLCLEKGWQLTIADNNYETVQAKAGGHPNTLAVQLDIENAAARKALVQQADVVISMMPHALHFLLAMDCIEFEKHLLTASYVDEAIQQLNDQIKAKKLLFLCEMGLDPGIDHMSAMQLFNRIRSEGGTITSFRSHCGGLVAPESDDNPWHYKISWNPRNIILAGKSGAIYKENGVITHVAYEELFDANRQVSVPGQGVYAYYPNRDSLGYIDLYDLKDASTFIRTTLRHPEFSFGWKHIIDLKLTNEDKVYDTDGMSVAAFFKLHFEKYGFTNRLNEMVEEENPTINAGVGIHQLNFLGLDDALLINKGLCSAADVLQFILERKLALEPNDKDLIVMLHEIGYELNNTHHTINSSLVVKGEDSIHTAMAKTVGLPLGIAAKLILEGKIQETGLHIPVIPSIYEPVLQELVQHGICFNEY